MISDILHDSQLQVRRLFKQFHRTYQELDPDIRKWLAHTKQLIKKIEQTGYLANHETFIEGQLQLGTPRRDLIIPPRELSAEEYLRQREPSGEDTQTPEASNSPSEPLSDMPATRPICPKCANVVNVTTTIEPASQPGYIMVKSVYECPQCQQQWSEQVDLPKEIALLGYNLEELMKGV
jgi:hypothetical protein